MKKILLSEYSKTYTDVVFESRNFNEVIDALRLIRGRRYLPATKQNIIPTKEIDHFKQILSDYFFEHKEIKKPSYYNIYMTNSGYYTRPEYVPIGKKDLRLNYLKRPRDGLGLHKFLLGEGVKSEFHHEVNFVPLELRQQTELYPFQEECMEFLRRNDYNGLVSLDMGLGKSLIASKCIEELGEGPALIVAPASILTQWQRELKKHFDYEANIITSRIRKQKRKQALQDSDITITNYEFLRTLDSFDMQWNILVLDEIQKVKNWKTKAAQTIGKIPALHVIGLSGTPVEKNLVELYNIIDTISPAHFGTMKQFYRDHIIKEYMGKYHYRNLEGVYQKLQQVMFRKRKEEIEMDLPEISKQHIAIPLTSKELDFYQINILDIAQNQGILAAIVFAKVFASSSGLRMDVDVSSKEKELLSIVHDLDERCIIFTQYVKELERIEKLLKKEVFSIYGDVPLRQRTPIIDQFEESDDGVLLLTDVGNFGLNLQKTRVLIHNDLQWTYSRMEQRLGRVHRIGSPHDKVFELTLTSEGTIDEDIMNLIYYRKDLSDITVDGVKKRLVEKLRQEVLI